MHQPVPCKDLLTWARWLETADRIVAKTNIGPLRVSTVFLGLDHAPLQGEPPQLFETMIFDGGEDGYQTRCSTWDEAEKMHAAAVEVARQELAKAKMLLSGSKE
jgi:hypothetical protein